MLVANYPSPESAEFVLIPDLRAVVVDGQEIAVTRTQYRILAALMSAPGRAFSREELVRQCIGTIVVERTVDVHVKELRRKLGAPGWRIETVRRVGYRFRDQG